MASIKMGAIVTDIRGKLGGHVFQKGNQSRVMRTGRKTPKRITELNTLTQNRVNARISGYNALSDANKAIWNSVANQHTFKNRFGDTVLYTGRQLYLYLNNNLSRAGLSNITSGAGLNSRVNAPAFSSIAFNIGAGTCTSGGATAPSGSRYVYMMQKISRNAVSPNPNKFIFNLSASSTSFNTNIVYPQYVARFGVPALTDNIWFKVTLVNAFGFESYSIIRKVTINA